VLDLPSVVIEGKANFSKDVTTASMTLDGGGAIGGSTNLNVTGELIVKATARKRCAARARRASTQVR
jgi:hypothetical protein